MIKEAKELSTFNTKNYRMRETYFTSDLVVGNLEYISSESGPLNVGPMIITTNQKYLFEEIEVNGKKEYREIFTGFVADTESCCLNLPYIVNVEPLNEVVPHIASNIQKKAFLLVMEEINRESKKLKK